jgi:hypothetical protein
MTGPGSAAPSDRPALERAVAAELTRRARYREAIRAGRLLDAVVPDCEVALRDLVGRGFGRIVEALEDDDGRQAAAWLAAIRGCLLLHRDLTAWQREQAGGAWDAAEWMRQLGMLEAKVAEEEARGEEPGAA